MTVERVDKCGSEGEEYGRRCEEYGCDVLEVESRQALCLFRTGPLTEVIRRGSDRAAADPFKRHCRSRHGSIASATRVSCDLS